MKPFDLLESPLSGTNLIEASAGTGKTYALAGLFVRLILEKGLSVGEVLVVTYTEAATEELRDRIRGKLREALKALSSEDPPEAFTDPFIAGLVRKVRDRAAAARLLREALHDFDQAPIFTIHGFCRRMLRENAFESGILFDTELLPDVTEIEQEIVYDFWRSRFYGAPIELVGYSLRKGISPKTLAALVRGKGAQPDLRIAPEPHPSGLDSLEAFRTAADALRAAWPSMRAEVLEKLQDPALNKLQYGNRSSIAAEMDRWVRHPVLPLPDKILKLSSGQIKKHTKKKYDSPVHPFFDLCRAAAERAESLGREMDGRLLSLKSELFRYIRRELPARKQKRNLQSFDDLLVRFRSALENGSGGAGQTALADRVRRKFKAALVDEFQDTDPVQYAIFRGIFEQGDSILFLIGDPKQAIYSFRGADLFAYIQAAGHVDTKYTLTGNRRSAPSLISAVNAVFSNRENPFLHREIAFEPSFPPQGSSAPNSGAFMIDGRSEASLQLWIMDGAVTGRPDEVVNKGAAYEEIPDAVAAEISRLIGLGRAGRAVIGGEKIRESDIAVLVRKNREARLVQKALTGRGIPSVLFSMENIFDTAEALEMERVLAGIAEPDREDLVRAALATDMLGADAGKLEMLLHDDTQWEAVLSRFREYCEVWERRGFIRMFRSFLAKEGIRERILSWSDGERRLTNILHLAEILHQASLRGNGSLADGGRQGAAGLVGWLARQRDPDAPRLEEHQIRLESDAEAVKIVTVHKSKGLEYPIVFCPFTWSGSRIGRGETFTFHDRKDGWKLNLVIDPEGNPNRRSAEEEILAENLRLLYVSLTRAKHRCYLVWGHFKDAGTSAPAYLFHAGLEGSDEMDAGDVLSAVESRFADLTDSAVRRELHPLLEKGAGSIQVSPMPSGSGVARIIQLPGISPHLLESRTVKGLRGREWQVASFSSLLAGGASRGTGPEKGTDLPDYDQGRALETLVPERDPAGLPGAPETGLFGFPGGSKAGIFFHELLEKLDFTERSESALEDLVAKGLEAYGYDVEWRDPVCRMLSDLLVLPIDPGCPGLLLGRIDNPERRNELAFYFPLKTVTPASLKKIFARNGVAEDETGIARSFPERIGRLDFQPARGYMKGYIDLVFRFGGCFYLADWKSNFLGNSREDYARNRLGATMIEAYYFLQYHIYTLALDSYLRTRIPDYDYDRDFGGVYYIFLRGLARSGPESGIFKDRPSKSLIEALRECLIG